ncbi:MULTISPECIES: single-stranded DNA-binding protein [unclassified Mycoplasma]|uniref:single-stranded DNA-binding protein n=1 Tax=unclassified Mycoplasma TaxID=2683645 RepID=UPI001C112016|nr:MULTISPECIES: single-stranded DNA-binding protein [unclassified Mycoplasma]MBU4693070.1 single-stranded DNA-binding protein [Mycoplasma sp. CSL7491-lung]MCU4706529.1 single-stranded DNA-binding protein [Mycoplasma sp. CSL7503-lung]
MNKVILIGRLTSTPVYNATSSGVGYTRFTLAINRRISNSSNNEITDFINVIAWRSTAELIAKNTTKGSKVMIEGSIQTNTYTSRETNQLVRSFDVVVDTFEFLESKDEFQRRLRNNDNNNQQMSNNGFNNNFNNNYQQQNNFNNQNQWQNNNSVQNNVMNSKHNFEDITSGYSENENNEPDDQEVFG